MLTVMLQMSLLIALGALWQRLAPNHIPPIAHRRALTDLVFFILLPALVLDVIWQAAIDRNTFKIVFVAVSMLFFAAVLMRLVMIKLTLNPDEKGALMLAAIFPNVTYLGLPVTNQVLGSWTNSVVLQYDLFACTPVLMTLGIFLAYHYGSSGQPLNPIKELCRIPALWAVMIAIVLNIFNVPRPEVIHGALSILSGGVVPLMLIAVGMSIKWGSLHIRYLPKLLPVAAISLVAVPLGMLLLTRLIHMPENIALAMTILSAMPTMVMGIVICERYQLASSLYAAAVTFTTILSVLTLSVWYHFLAGV